MDTILGYRPRSRSAIIEMDCSVLQSARSAIVRSYQEFGLLETVLDAAALGGMRALIEPHDPRHITRALVRSLVAESFDAYWDKTGMNGPYGVKVSWQTALNCATQARRRARKLRVKTAHTKEHDTEASSLKICATPRADSPPYSYRAPSIIWDDSEPLLGLEMLANPSKARVAHEASENTSPR
jgi:hypothetical protein